jgi:hypothetical protein
MSADTDTEYTPGQLRQMDESTARSTLTVDQFERWEKIQDLYDDAEETREQWADADETVTEISVSADPEALGTHVDVFGNDLLVHIDAEDDRLRAVAGELDGFDLEAEDGEGYAVPEDADIDALAEALTNLLDLVIVRWDGTVWADLAQPERDTVLADARAGWGVDGLLLAWVDIMAAVNEDRQERMGAIESFHGAERDGGRRGSR